MGRNNYVVVQWTSGVTQCDVILLGIYLLCMKAKLKESPLFNAGPKLAQNLK